MEIDASNQGTEKKKWADYDFAEDASDASVDLDISPAYNFSEMGLKLVDGHWGSVNDATFDERRFQFGNFCIEIFLRHMPEFNPIYEATAHLDQPFVYNNHHVTPDIIYNRPGKLTPDIFEFKTFLSEPKDSVIEAEISEIQRKYGPEAKPIFLFLDEQFPRRYFLRQNEIKIYRELRQDLIDYIRVNPKLLKEEIKLRKRSVPDRDLLLEKTFLSHEPWIPLHKNYDEEFATLDDCLEDFATMLPDFEKFVNFNFQDMLDLTESLPFNKDKDSNIFPNHPWDRDLNRLKTDTYRSSNTTFGHRANYLMKFPCFNKIKTGVITENVLRDIFYSIDNTMLPTELAQMVRSSIKLNLDFKGELEKLKEFHDIAAFVKTEAQQAQVDLIAKNVLGREATSTELLNALHQKRSELAHRLSAKAESEISLSLRGNLVFRLSSESSYATGIERAKHPDIPKKKKDTIDKISFENLNFDFSKLKVCGFNTKPWQVNLEAAYLGSPSLKLFVDAMNNESLSELNDVIESEQFAVINEMWTFCKAHSAALPRSKTKGETGKSFSLIPVPDRQVLWFGSPSPNEITTGALFHVAILQKNERFPEFFIPHTYIDKDDYTIAVSSIYRENLKYVEQYTAMVGSFIAYNFLNKAFKMKVMEDWLFTSFYVAPARQLVLAFDIIYMFYKNIFQVGSFGRIEFPKKLEKLELKDIRVVTIIKRLKENFQNTVATYRQNDRDIKFKLPDPIFNFTHQSLQSLLSVTYLKQIYIKDDGFDATKYLWGFFLDELSFQRKWLDSPFNPSKTNPAEPMSGQEFYEKLMKTETEWVDVSYWPDFCYRISQYMYDEATKKDINLPGKGFNDKPGVKTGKSTKVLFPSVIKEAPGTDKSKYKGVASVVLSEALYTESLMLDKHIKDPSPDSPWYDPGIKYNLNGSPPTLVEMACFEKILYPPAVVLMMKEKVQTGYGKRGFFVQTLHGRNINKIRDESIRPIQKFQEGDLILSPGSEKYLKLEKDMQQLGYKENRYLTVTEDETKYGDTYPMQAMSLNTIALFKRGYFSEPEAKFNLYADECIAHRFIMMPEQCVKLYDVTRQKISKEEKLTNVEGKIAVTVEEYALLLDQPDKFKYWTKGSFIDEVRQNPGITKEVGFTLGVLNIIGTALTEGHNLLVKLSWERLGLYNMTRHESHSDDSISFTGFLVPSSDIFKVNIFDNPVLKELFVKGGTIVGKSAEGFSFRTVGGKEGIITHDEIGKIHVMMTLLAPRTVGQRPSLTKWTCGDIGEILQVQCIDGNVVVPLIRHAVSIAADLPSHSPGEDLQMAAGRVYDVILNGSGTKLSNNLLLAINYIIYKKYGIPDEYLDINKPPQYGGIWYAYPAFFLSSGFSANEARLWSNAIYDQQLHRLLVLTENTDTVWAQRDNTERTNQIEVLKEQFKIDPTEVTDVVIGGAPETRKDFKIRFNKHVKTSKAFTKMVDLYRDYLKDAMKSTLNQTYDNLISVLDITDSKFIRYLTKAWVPYSLGVVNSLPISAAFYIQKYLTTSWAESYLRIQPGTKVVAALGYLNRKFSNPFSEKVTEEMMISQIVTVREVWDILDKLAKSTFPTGETAEKFATLHKSILSVYMSEINSAVVVGDFKDRSEVLIETKLKYFKISDKRMIRGLTFRLPELLSAHLEQSLYKKKLSETAIVKQKPQILGDDSFSQSLKVLKTILEQSGFSIMDVVLHQRLILRALTLKDFQSVVKAESPNDIVGQYFGALFSYHEKIDVKVEVSILDTYIETTTRNLDLAKTRATAIGLMHMGINKLQPLPFRVLYRGKEDRVVTLTSILEEIVKGSDSKLVLTKLLVHILHREYTQMVNAIGRGFLPEPLLTFYKHPHEPRLINAIDYAGMKVVLYFQKTGKKDGKAIYQIEGFTNDDKSQFVKALIIMITTFLTPGLVSKGEIWSSFRITDNSKGDFSMFDTTMIYKSKAGNINLRRISDDIMNLKLSDLVPSTNETYFYRIPVTMKYRYGDELEEVDYYDVVPWSFIREVSFMTIEVAGEEVLRDDVKKQRMQKFKTYLCEDNNLGKKLGFPEMDIYSKVPIDICVEVIRAVEYVDHYLSEVVNTYNLVDRTLKSLVEIRKFEIYIGMPITVLLWLVQNDEHAKLKKLIIKKKQPSKRNRRVQYDSDEDYDNQPSIPFGAEDPNNNNAPETLDSKVKTLLSRLPSLIDKEDIGSNWSVFSIEKLFKHKDSLEDQICSKWAEILSYSIDSAYLEQLDETASSNFSSISRDFNSRFDVFTNIPLSLISIYLNATPNCYDIADLFNYNTKKDIIWVLGGNAIDTAIFNNILYSMPDCESLLRKIIPLLVTV